MKNRDMLSFYRDQSVAPVRQNVPDLSVHLRRRKVLYQQLGIAPGAFCGRRVLEVGPGTGQNSLFVAAQGPRQLVLVEPNPTGVAEIREAFEPHAAWRELLTVYNVPVEQYSKGEPFDFVLCEGLIGASGHHDPAALVAAVTRHVRAGGWRS